jgi:hypothetical protein
LATKLEQLSAEWQELKKAQDQTQADMQKLQIEAEQLRSQQGALQQLCQQLTSEKSEMLQKLRAEEATSLNSRQALKSLFPFQFYKEGNNDLVDLDEDHLALHYLQYGQHEARLKTYQELDTELKFSLKQCEEADGRLMLLDMQFEMAKQQLETMKDLFARLAERPQSDQQAKDR